MAFAHNHLYGNLNFYDLRTITFNCCFDLNELSSLI